MSGDHNTPLTKVMAEEAGASDVRAARAAASGARKAARRRKSNERAEMRLWFICVAFLMVYGALGLRMAQLAAMDPAEPRLTLGAATGGVGRAPITDRNGRLLAADLPAWSIYAHPPEMKKAGVRPEVAARRLAAAVAGVDEAALRHKFETRGGLVWVKRPASPSEMQAAHNLGIPGVHFGNRETRVYPNGRIAAHILGGARAAEETVRSAELVGLAGVERLLDDELRDPDRMGRPLALTIDLTAQTALTEVLSTGMKQFNAIAAAGVLMDVTNGEVLALVSLPDFDPNDRPNPNDPKVKLTRPMMNRAAEGVFELGSTMKLFAAAQALDEGVAGLETMLDTAGPIRMGRHRIGDFHRMPPRMSLRDVIIESSNVGTSRLALAIGPDAQRAFLDKFGFLDATPIELAEARLGKPLLPDNWGRLQSMTISFGHGLAASPLHLAAGYASLVNGGLKVEPTLRFGGAAPTEADRVISPATSLAVREMLRAVVADGTGRSAGVPGYEVGGKTGTAEKPSRGGYDRNKMLNTFAAIFPASRPKYVLIVTLDEAEVYKFGAWRRTAGWTAAPTAGIAIRRLAPILGMRPRPPAANGPALLNAGAE
ncbi:MAG: peptidoglycan D,D-transpeptidase FtsI family protein [Pikeienuella sp.]